MNQPLPQQIKNLNEAYSDQFKLILRDAKETTFHCQNANIPGISQSVVRVPNQNNYIQVNSTKLEYENLNITFKVDEDLNNYFEIYAWLIGITAPQRFEQFEEFQTLKNFWGKTGYITTVTASIIQLTQVYNPNIEIVFTELQPVALSGLDFTLSGRGEPLIATATFSYDYYTIKKSK